MEYTLLYRLLPLVPYLIAVVGGIFSGSLVYSGLANSHERRNYRLRLKATWQASKEEVIQEARQSETEQLLKDARNPLGLNALKLYIIIAVIALYYSFNYIILGYLKNGYVSLGLYLLGLLAILLLNPGWNISYVKMLSPTRFILKKFIDFRKARRTAELFSLYDLLVSEIEMMRNERVNIYNLIRTMLPYFKELNRPLTKMLSEWSTSTTGPYQAIDNFAEEIGTGEAKSLATVLKTFDENSRETILESLEGMEEMFMKSQIENNRRSRKLFVDLVGLPIYAAHGLILLNGLLVIIMMVVKVMNNSNLDNM